MTPETVKKISRVLLIFGGLLIIGSIIGKWKMQPTPAWLIPTALVGMVLVVIYAALQSRLQRNSK
jgi:predicted MFS family arabinose efflux permease